VVQAVEHLLCKHKGLSSNPSPMEKNTPKTKQNNNKKTKQKGQVEQLK
jgi:hypothetical protein